MNAQQPVNQNEWLAVVSCAYVFLTLPFDKVPGANKEEFTTAATELLEVLIDRVHGKTPTMSQRTADLIHIVSETSGLFAKGALH